MIVNNPNKINYENVSSIWFTSDTHFGHENIIKYTKRPFQSVEEMDKELIKRWNDVVAPDDTVYHLGDFTLGNINKFQFYIEQLNGRINILSNKWHHDKYWIKDYHKDFDIKAFVYKFRVPILLDAIEVLTIDDDSKYGKKITLCHYPLEEWESKYYGSIHLHGHIHTVGYRTHTLNKLDVGVDNNNFAPINLYDIMQLLF